MRLKRLRSEELLIPLRTKKVRKSPGGNMSFSGNRVRQFTKDENKNLIIHRAFSLNPHIKLKHINISRDQYYDHNDQPSPYSRVTTPNEKNESWNDSESNMFSSFHHATPTNDSTISGNTESGFSASTPQCSNDNLNLLLKIAAERAFINNNLKEFGYSPIQFQMYNDFNELNIFLKYLIDEIDIN